MRLRGEISGFKGQHGSRPLLFHAEGREGRDRGGDLAEHLCSGSSSSPRRGWRSSSRARVTTYPDKSKYQIVIDELEPAGVGALMALLEQRKTQLAAEGLFDADRKRPLPFLPRIVGVVTSPTGAVIRDILHRLADRFPCHVLVWPVRVQGETCAVEVAAAIHGFNGLMRRASVPRPDLIIVARGGGSLEDLWGFNEEIVARAAAASTIPLISAVGHETDWTIIDLVADFRAPTPTAAAERAVPVRAELHIQVTSFGLRVMSCLRRLVEGQRTMLLALARGLPRRSEILALPRQRFDGVSARLGRALHANAHAHRVALARARPRGSGRISWRRAAQGGRERLRPPRPLRRRALSRLGGAVAPAPRCAHRSSSIRSAITTCSPAALPSPATPKARMLRRAADVHRGERLDIEFADGHVPAQADGGDRKATPSPKRARGRDEKQGTLL